MLLAGDLSANGLGKHFANVLESFWRCFGIVSRFEQPCWNSIENLEGFGKFWESFWEKFSQKELTLHTEVVRTARDQLPVRRWNAFQWSFAAMALVVAMVVVAYG